MKKILAAIMSIVIVMSMTACGNNKAQQIEPAPVDEPELELSVSDLDVMMKDCFGEGFIESKYEDGLYGVAVTADGMHYAVGTSEYYDLCDAMGELSETINTVFDIDNFMLLVDDVDNNIVYFATYNGVDITDELS